MSKGEKLFVISSYNTVGAGQNLQYKAPGNATIVAVNDYDRGDMEKDFDCIYLEKPTNLLVNVDSKKGIEAEDLIRFVYQMEFLMERGEVSRKDGIAVIFKKVLPLMGVEFVRYGMLTVVPFPFKYLREYIVKEEKSV